jgi:MFS family permease
MWLDNSNYPTSSYLPSFLEVINAVPNQIASLILIAASVSAFFAAVLVGSLSDGIGRKTTFLLVGVCAAVLLPFCFPRPSNRGNTGRVDSAAARGLAGHSRHFVRSQTPMRAMRSEIKVLKP